MKRMVVLLIALFALTSVTALDETIDQEALSTGFLFRCQYEVERNRYGIDDMIVNRVFESDEFFECPTTLKVPFKTVDETELTQDEAADGFDFDCTYVPQETWHELDVPNIELTFNSRDYFECPRIALDFIHTGDLSIASTPKHWSIIESGEEVSYEVSDQRIPVSMIDFDVRDKDMAFEDVELSIATVKQPISDLGKKDSVYEYMRISKTGIENQEVREVKISFFVSKAWLENNDIDPGTIGLYRYKDANWNKLTTQMIEENPQNYRYESVSPGFSLFAIAGDEIQRETGMQDQPISDRDQQSDSQPNMMQAENNGLSAVQWSVIIIAVLVAAALVIIAISMRRR